MWETVQGKIANVRRIINIKYYPNIWEGDVEGVPCLWFYDGRVVDRFTQYTIVKKIEDNITRNR